MRVFVVLFLVVGVAVTSGLVLLSSGSVSTPPDGPSAMVLSSGLSLYGNNCASCHGADGKGNPGSDPPLLKTVIVTGDPITLIRVMTQGTAKVILLQQRSKWTNTMPVNYNLTDEQIAQLLTYIRHDFGANSSPIETAQVAKVRLQYGGPSPGQE